MIEFLPYTLLRNCYTMFNATTFLLCDKLCAPAIMNLQSQGRLNLHFIWSDVNLSHLFLIYLDVISNVLQYICLVYIFIVYCSTDYVKFLSLFSIFKGIRVVFQKVLLSQIICYLSYLFGLFQPNFCITS